MADDPPDEVRVPGFHPQGLRENGRGREAKAGQATEELARGGDIYLGVKLNPPDGPGGDLKGLDRTVRSGRQDVKISAKAHGFVKMTAECVSPAFLAQNIAFNVDIDGIPADLRPRGPPDTVGAAERQGDELMAIAASQGGISLRYDFPDEFGLVFHPGVPFEHRGLGPRNDEVAETFIEPRESSFGRPEGLKRDIQMLRPVFNRPVDRRVDRIVHDRQPGVSAMSVHDLGLWKRPL